VNVLRRRDGGTVAADAYLLFAFSDFKFGDSGFLNQVNQRFYLSQIHVRRLLLLIVGPPLGLASLIGLIGRGRAPTSLIELLANPTH
jgi:hypothetical protein